LCSASPGWPLQKALKKAGARSDMCLVWKRHKSIPRSSLLELYRARSAPILSSTKGAESLQDGFIA
jgi:hypothetical protein